MKRSVVSLQRNARALDGRGAGNNSHLIGFGLLLLSAVLLNAPVARAQLRKLPQQIVLAGGAGWNTLPNAYFDSAWGSGFVSNNPYVGAQFDTWAAAPGVQVLVGSFRNLSNTGVSDIALVGIPGVNFVPIAEGNANGTFTLYLSNVGNFASWAAAPGVRALVGDFNNDGR